MSISVYLLMGCGIPAWRQTGKRIPRWRFERWSVAE